VKVQKQNEGTAAGVEEKHGTKNDDDYTNDKEKQDEAINNVDKDDSSGDGNNDKDDEKQDTDKDEHAGSNPVLNHPKQSMDDQEQPSKAPASSTSSSSTPSPLPPTSKTVKYGADGQVVQPHVKTVKEAQAWLSQIDARNREWNEKNRVHHPKVGRCNDHGTAGGGGRPRNRNNGNGDGDDTDVDDTVGSKAGNGPSPSSPPLPPPLLSTAMDRAKAIEGAGQLSSTSIHSDDAGPTAGGVVTRVKRTSINRRSSMKKSFSKLLGGRYKYYKQ